METPSNSYHTQPQVTGGSKQGKLGRTGKQKLEAVVSNDVTITPPSPVKKFGSAFFGGHIKDVFRFLLIDVLLPSGKNLFVDLANKGVDRMVYGDRPSARQSTNRLAPRMSYNGVAQSQTVMLPGQPPLANRGISSRMDLGEIILSSRSEAEMVLERLMDVIGTHDVTSVADLYDLLNLPAPYSSNNWGWTNLSSSTITQVRQGFLLSLPQAMAL